MPVGWGLGATRVRQTRPSYSERLRVLRHLRQAPELLAVPAGVLARDFVQVLGVPYATAYRAIDYARDVQRLAGHGPRLLGGLH